MGMIFLLLSQSSSSFCWIDWRYDHGLYLIQLDTFFGFYAFNIESHQTRPRARSGVGVGRTFSGELGPVVVALAHTDAGIQVGQGTPGLPES